MSAEENRAWVRDKIREAGLTEEVEVAALGRIVTSTEGNEE